MGYWEYALVNVDNVLVISCVPIKTIEGIKLILKLEGDKAEPTNIYLEASLEKSKTNGENKCWLMS